jgi:xanthine dehydrogenase accessory factor
MSKTILEKINDLQESGETFVIATLVKTKGSAPQEVGAKILVGANGYIDGTIGGGKVEERVIQHAKAMIKTNESFDYADWNLQTDIKMTCGGVVSFFFERVQAKPTWEIAIFGAGHVAQEVVRTLLKLDCSITCSDPRLEWLNKLPDHHKLTKIHTGTMKDVVATLKPGTFIASMTMGHAFDLPIILAAMERNVFPYMGVIGSDSKAAVLKSDLLKNGADEKLVAALNCPIGEPLGNNTPAEIAISITAQLLKQRDLSVSTK